ncbi:hypothetical protein KEM54_002700 [Ascosphaera aggregata]|nr:hypothetical protein KEM54_002700 [Ascosphaera aggregata]
MGKAGRCACIFLPYLLGIGALVCLIMVFLGDRYKTDTLQKLWLMKIDTSELKTDIDNDSDLRVLAQALGKSAGQIKDWYTIGLWNQCHGSYKGDEMITEGCSSPHRKYWFDPKKEFNLGDIPVERLYSADFKEALEAYQKASEALYYIFIVAFITTILEILVGIGAIFSRWGSFFTTLVSLVAGVFTVALAIYVSVIFPIISGAINNDLADLKIKSSIGRRVLACLWIAVLCAAVSFLFWFSSICCCSGKSPYGHKGDRPRGRGINAAEKGTYNYERVGPFGPGGAANDGSQVPLTSMAATREGGTAYEPFRHA